MKKKYITLYSVLALLAVLFSSCLKNEANYTDFSKVGALVELPLSAYTGAGKLTPVALPIQAAAQPISIVVNLAAPQPLKSNLTVTLALDPAALKAYNDKNIAQYKADSTAAANDATGATAEPTYPTIYTMLPSTFFTLSGLTAVIPANQNTASITANVVTKDFDLSASYVLPISITDASGQKISNYKTILFNVQAKNKYDGVYTVTGTLSDANVGTITGKYPLTGVYLKTQSATTAVMFDPGLNGGTYGHQILNGTSPSYYGNFAPIFTFGADNVITAVTNYYGQGTNSSTRAAQLATGSTPTATGTPGTTGFSFTVKYIMVQAGSPRTTITETWKYTGARP